MDAKELHQTMSMCHPNNWVITNPEIRATILRALALLASVEGSSDEVVRELQRVVLPSLRDYGQGYSAAVAERAASHIIALRAELERERMRLCACGVAAMANTPESAANARQTHPDYRSASLSDVEQAVDREMALRAELARVKANCKIVYWPKDGSYPIEHTMAANKDCYEMILAQMERDRAAHPKDAP